MLHLCKLAVGARDLNQLRLFQAERLRVEAPLRHRTRNAPRRAAEVLAGGSLYWVINGVLAARQPVLAIEPDCWDDGSACTGLFLQPDPVPVIPRTMKPFQGWRYLAAADAPPDAPPHGAADGEDALPHTLRLALQALCLL
jgi:hypothetical protein